MAKGVVDMTALAELIEEIIADGANEVELGYQPRSTSAKGILENKGAVMIDLYMHVKFVNMGFLSQP